MTRVSKHWGYKLISYLIDLPVETAHSTVSGKLQVRMVNGRLLLDTAHANYSYGSLHRLFRMVFKKIGIGTHPPDRVLLLGLGGGSVVSILRDEYGLHMPITAVDSDPEVIRMAREHFAIDQYKDLEVICGDAVDWIRSSMKIFGMIVIDLFVDNDVPEPATSVSFLEDCTARIAGPGVIIFNFIVSSGEQREKYDKLLLNAIAAGLEFSESRLLSSNRVLILRRRS